jgi:hypothetical protein
MRNTALSKTNVVNHVPLGLMPSFCQVWILNIAMNNLNQNLFSKAFLIFGTWTKMGLDLLGSVCISVAGFEIL